MKSACSVEFSIFTITRSALTIVLRTRDLLVRICDEEQSDLDEERSNDEYNTNTDKWRIRAAFTRILETMRQYGAREIGSDVHHESQEKVNLSSGRRRRSRNTALDIPTPPYALDLGPDLQYTGLNTPQEYIQPSTAEESTISLGKRSRLRLLRRFKLKGK
jgi:hypothetical protein